MNVPPFPEPWRLWRYLSNGSGSSSFTIEDANRREIAIVEFPGSRLISEQEALEVAVMLIGNRQYIPWTEPPPRRSRWLRRAHLPPPKA